MVIGPPPDLAATQCQAAHAYHGPVQGGSMDGSLVVVVAWLPSAEEIEAIKNGQPVYLSCLGGLLPHFLTTDFNQATHPA